MNAYAVAATLIKNNGGGNLNIRTSLHVIEAVSEEESIGKFMIMITEGNPEHYVHVRPASLLIDEDV